MGTNTFGHDCSIALPCLYRHETAPFHKIQPLLQPLNKNQALTWRRTIIIIIIIHKDDRDDPETLSYVDIWALSGLKASKSLS